LSAEAVLALTSILDLLQYSSPSISAEMQNQFDYFRNTHTRKSMFGFGQYGLHFIQTLVRFIAVSSHKCVTVVQFPQALHLTFILLIIAYH
jgi:hypothetical protein